MSADFDEAELALLLVDPALWSEPSQGLADRVVAAVVAAAAAESAPEKAPVVDLHQWRNRRWLAPVGAAIGGAAAAALLTVALTPRHDDGSVSSAANPALIATLALTGTDLATGVQGSADVSVVPSGVQIRIRAPGLPRREGDEFYQGWLKSCDSTRLVPIGTFHELADATGWAGVSIDKHPIVTITRESVAGPKDVAQGSSGEVVLSGKLAPCP